MNPPVTARISERTVTGNAWQWTGPYTLEAVRAAATGARNFLEALDFPANEAAAWELLVTEVGNNCVLHGGLAVCEKSWEAQLICAHDRVIGTFSDATSGFVWPENPELPDDDAESGRGVFLIHSLTDVREYSRGKTQNILTLERSHDHRPPAEDLNATLDAMTEELASCYESLSSIFRFTEEARGTTSLKEFSASLLRHLLNITRADCGILRAASGNRLTTLATHGCEAIPDCIAEESSLSWEAAAVASRQDQWIDETVADCPVPSGLVHPFFHEDELMGVLHLGRHASAVPFNAGEVNMVHTFAEFLSQQMLSRRHEDEAIRSSVARREFELAAAIQRSLLPPPSSEISGISVAGHCESALSIGGDFYDVIPFGNDGCFFVIADVMGKGVAASMMAAVARSIVRAFSHFYQFPARLLERVAVQMFQDLDRLEMFVTIAVGVVDVRKGVIRVANAGHCPVLAVAPGDALTEAAPLQPPLGLEPNPVFMEYEIPLKSGSRLLAYTDGLMDPRNGRPGFDTQDEVASWFATAAAGAPPLSSLKDSLLQRLGHGSDSGTLADDQTFLFIGLH